MTRAPVRSVLAGALAWVAGCLEPTPEFVDPRGDLLVEWVFDRPGPTIGDLAEPMQVLELQGGEWVSDDGPPHVRFDGIDDVGVGPDLKDIVPTLERVTLEAHVRIDPQSEDWNSRPIVNVPQSSATGDFPLSLTVYTAGRRLELGVVAGDVHGQLYRDELYEPGQWLTIHGVYDGAEIQLYIDGEAPVDPIPLSGTLDAYDFDFNAQPIRVGGDSSPNDHLAFGLSQLRIYARALEPGEVAYRAELLSRNDPP